MPEAHRNTQESAMAHKPYHDPREQSVADPIVLTRAEQVRRCEAIEEVHALVRAHGTSLVLGWVLMTPPQEEVAELVREFGRDLIRKYVGYFADKRGRGRVPERPVDRCLADGAALVNSICVQCGRDNS